MKKCVLAIDAGGTFLKAALMENGEIVRESADREKVDSDKGTAQQVRAAYAALIGREKETAERLGLTVAAVAVDTPGPFDFANGTPMMTHKYRAIYGISVKPWIKEAVGEDVPVSFIHDSHAFILGVARDVPQYTRIAGAMIGTGLGFAMMTDGSPRLNADGGPAVSIYNKPYRAGVAEDYISGRGIIRRYNALAPEPTDNAKQIGDAADAGDMLACDVYAETGKMLAEVLKPILEENKIEALIIGGQIARSFPIFADALKKGLHTVHTLKYIAAAKNIDDAHLYGAADSVKIN